MTTGLGRFTRGLATASIAITLLLAGVSARVTTTAQADANQAVAPASFQDLRWRNVGPSRGGRATAYSGVRQQPNVFYMGPTGGGVWKSEDYGVSWRPISDGQISTGSIGWIEVAPSNPDIVWVGTGSAAIRSNVIIGRGVYKSVDAGVTWRFMGLPNAGQIGTVRIHPANPDIVWLSALGSPFGPNEERGIFKTTDGGQTWRRTLYVNAETGGRDLEVDPSNPDVLYAGMYRGFRKGWDIISGGPASEGGIYKSTDAGETWRKLETGLPQDLIGKIDLDVARSNPRIVYAMIEAPGDEGGLYRSSDAGATWALVNNSQRLRARPFYFNYVHVHPANEDEVWVNELGLHRSRDGGKTFTTVPTPHGDNHGMWFNPDRPDIILQVNDGGANVSLNAGVSWSSILNQPTAEFYMVSVDEQHPYRLYTPQQDNSTVVVPSLPPVSWSLDHASELWMQGPGCETGQIWPRPDGQVIFGACKGEFGRYNVATGQEKHYWIYPQNRYGHRPDEIKYRFPRQTVVYLSPHDPNVVYQASHVVHRSTDEGVTWEVISPDLTAFEKEYQVVPGSPITRDITGEEVYSNIYAMVESRLEPGVLWVGANDGPVHVSRDNGRTWKNVTPKDLLPGGRVQTIEDSPHRRGTAYIAVYRFLREHDLAPYIYRTDDYGETWTRLTDGRNGIPGDHPTRVVREDPAQEGLLYAGTEFGFFVSFDAGRRWQPLQQNLPATPVTDLRVHRNDLVISTMGRSLWIMDNVTPLHEIAARVRTAASAPATHFYAPRDVTRYRYVGTGPDPMEPEYPAPGAHFDLHFEAAPPADARLEVADASGAVIRTLRVALPRPGETTQDMRAPVRGPGGVSTITPRAGMQRVTWDLRHHGPWTVATPAGGPGGPLAAPGRYTVTLRAGTTTVSHAFDVQADPRVLRDNVTNADLIEQTRLLLGVRDAISRGRQLQVRIEQAMESAQVSLPPSAPPGTSPFDQPFAHPLQELWARVVDMRGPYPQPMLLNQFNNINRMLTRGDQKVGRDAYERFDDLMKELEEIEARALKAGVAPR
ncbi:MAG: hypothetical protein Q8L86_08945 [Vicinamibacterales bacterium]|nr:hypothetical protein [Vicinamibacterales bacterium]